MSTRVPFGLPLFLVFGSFMCIYVYIKNQEEPRPPRNYVLAMRRIEIERIGVRAFHNHPLYVDLLARTDAVARLSTDSVTQSSVLVIRDKTEPEIAAKVGADSIWGVRDGEWELRVTDYRTTSPVSLWGTPFFSPEE